MTGYDRQSQIAKRAAHADRDAVYIQSDRDALQLME
jgi:hypothetical protein